MVANGRPRGVSIPLVTAVLGLLAVAFATAPASSRVFNPKTFTLANGLQVVVVESHRAPIAVQMIWYRVGAADEPHGKSGIAHFLEHLMFKGTPSVPPGQFSKIVARNGGMDNAFTSHDYTAYFQRVARDKLELIMRLEADRMTNLRLTDAEVVPERDVVLEERRSRTDNNPGAQLYERRRAVTYLRHPYRIPVIGWKREIEGLTTEDALAFYRTHYAPDNAVLIIAGDVSVAEVRELAERYYGPIPARGIPPRVRPVEPESLAAKRVIMKSARVHLPRLTISYRAPSFNTGAREHTYPLQVLAEALGSGSTSRLYRALVVEQDIASSVGSWYSAVQVDHGEFSISIMPKVGGEVGPMEAALKAEIQRLLEHGITEAELVRVKRSMLAGAIFARDGIRAAPNIIGRALVTGRTIADIEAWPERITAVTVEQVRAAARAILVEKHSVTSVLLPDSTS